MCRTRWSHLPVELRSYLPVELRSYLPVKPVRAWPAIDTSKIPVQSRTPKSLTHLHHSRVNRSTMSPPPYILGSGHFAVTWSEDDVAHLPEVLQEAGITQIDSAALYPITSSGKSERLIGENQYVEKGFQVDTKVMWFGDGRGHLTADAIEKSVTASLERLKVKKVHYLPIFRTRCEVNH